MAELLVMGISALTIILLVAIVWCVGNNKKIADNDSPEDKCGRFQKYCKDYLDEFIQLSQFFH